MLENEAIKLDQMFIASLVFDLIRVSFLSTFLTFLLRLLYRFLMDDLQGMTYLHDSPLKCHGNLCTANCLIDSRWVVKLSDFGLYAFKKGGNTTNGCENGNNNNLHDNNGLYEEDMMIPIRRGSTDSKKITVKYESKNWKQMNETVEGKFRKNLREESFEKLSENGNYAVKKIFKFYKSFGIMSDMKALKENEALTELELPQS